MQMNQHDQSNQGKMRNARQITPAIFHRRCNFNWWNSVHNRLQW